VHGQFQNFPSTFFSAQDGEKINQKYFEKRLVLRKLLSRAKKNTQHSKNTSSQATPWPVMLLSFSQIRNQPTNQQYL
jgi:hypothetical protein